MLQAGVEIRQGFFWACIHINGESHDMEDAFESKWTNWTRVVQYYTGVLQRLRFAASVLAESTGFVRKIGQCINWVCNLGDIVFKP